MLSRFTTLILGTTIKPQSFAIAARIAKIKCQQSNSNLQSNIFAIGEERSNWMITARINAIAGESFIAMVAFKIKHAGKEFPE